MVATMNPTAINRALQMELDFEIDRERHERRDWQRALDRNLQALQDYVYPHQLIIWQPGDRENAKKGSKLKAFDVQLTTTTSCTCSRFKLRDHCEHIEFTKRLEEAGIPVTTDAPVRAVDLEGGQV